MAGEKDIKMAQENIDIPQEQIKYANLLLYGAWTSIAILAVTYILYVFGIVEPFIAPEKMPEYWSMSSTDFLHENNIDSGWGWFKLIGYGDFLNYIGVLLLGALTIIGYAVLLLKSYIRQKDTIYTVIVVTEILVLLLAASGILGAGGH